MVVSVVAVALAVLIAWTRQNRQRNIEIGAAGALGRGIFAARDIRRGEVIEECPLVVAPEESWGPAMEDYVFQHSDGKSALALGMCSLYNHSDEYNAEYQLAGSSSEVSSEGSDDMLRISAMRDIARGEQIFISYGPEWWEGRGRKPT